MYHKVMLGMSGGVDSSVAAYLLKKEGYQVSGVFMQNWREDAENGFCTSKEDTLDAIAVADMLGIDIDIVNFEKEYQEKVFQYFLQEYAAGRTPNPDVLCNSEIKFKAFLDHALAQGADYIATGHYVRKKIQEGKTYLLKAKDLHKDQSYFLYRINGKQLHHSLFPLGELTKKEVRFKANEIKLPTASKKDSTGICFIGERPFREFLSHYLVLCPGIMRSPEGKILGEHMGLAFYTIGQRQGLGIGGNGAPWYVAAKDISNNELLVVQGHDHPLLFSKELVMNDLSFIDGQRPAEGEYQVKIRYRMPDIRAELNYLADDEAKLRFGEPVWAVTPGQSAVIYNGDICLGGGIISKAIAN